MNDTGRWSGPAAAVLAAALMALAVIAWASPAPDRVTDRDVYEATAARGIVRDCSDLHCFRVLVPWVLGSLPGPSIVKWKAYAVVCNATAAAGVFILTLTFGLSRRTAMLAAAASAFGFGSLYTLHDVYTSDPLMFALGPILTHELLAGRILLSGAVACVGVLAKEFAAAPVYVAAGYHAVGGRWSAALKSLVAGNAVFIVWLLFTLTLMLRFNYSWGATDSANLATGAGIGPWLQRQSTAGIASAMFNEFGVLWLLMPFGFMRAPRVLQVLTLVALPPAAVFAYVQQPDRALWNFHFLFVPLAAIVLARAPAALAWAAVAAFAIGNLRVGAQLPMAGVGRAAIALSIVLGLAAMVVPARD